MIVVCPLKPGASFTASGPVFCRVGLKSLQKAVDGCLSSLIPMAMIKHFDQKKFRGKKRFTWLILPSYSPSLEELG